ncbi:MAG: S1C family serine protease [Thermomicrobiales bacterium]
MTEESVSRFEPLRQRLETLRQRIGPWRPRWERWRQRLERPRLWARRALPFVAGMLAALAALWVYNALTPDPHQLTAQDVNTSIQQAMASATAPPPFSAAVYQRIRPSFVLIQTKGADENGEPGQGLGSGVIITNRADILTALHVVANSDEIQVFYADGTQSPAQIVTADEKNDIAVIRPAKPPTVIVPATLGNPNAMHIGDEAFVVGNPLGLYASMSSGVISGFDRSFTDPDTETSLEGLIQFDAAVNPGNSGGPLINRQGQVVGIVTGLVNPTDQNFFIGIGFAVPITTAGGAAGLPPR